MKILFLLNKAYQSLKTLFDPSIEGDPYQIGPENRADKTYQSYRSNWFYKLNRRYVVPRA